ncbi:hypothetical protein PF005_g14721 [Phytophthora fragariae]|uniref:Uncharacterized protein n=1 Tax=Phytophthora fragariae TaxID=53985 RepID=A0A6A3XG24_9STRA|nr:hypothetical protein PF007_g15132 [Phytophthora fragariae]KAE9202051.1 hypothetical protein PF005_g14721 [Phytophthora fragariae]KAE9218107.1 hypothetical protein PF004_g13970 [Phytophthora fragariae]KAE9302030.1 hypothetical protein PF001_g14187 [Phytophthora fragariae]KAE9334310.1 hypothetical protein PF008_g14034 [Phytophthora fragariae]
MDRRDARRRSRSPCARRRGHRGSSTSSSDRSEASDGGRSFSRRDRHSRRHNSTSRSCSQSPRRSERYRRRHRSRSRSKDSQKAVRYGDTFSVAQRDSKRQEERNPRAIRRVVSAKASGEVRRIAPNASALKSLMVGTARSRDRMDERERARAQKKLESLNTTAQGSRQ